MAQKKIPVILFSDGTWENLDDAVLVLVPENVYNDHSDSLEELIKENADEVDMFTLHHDEQQIISAKRDEREF